MGVHRDEYVSWFTADRENENSLSAAIEARNEYVIKMLSTILELVLHTIRDFTEVPYFNAHVVGQPKTSAASARYE